MATAQDENYMERLTTINPYCKHSSKCSNFIKCLNHGQHRCLDYDRDYLKTLKNTRIVLFIRRMIAREDRR